VQSKADRGITWPGVNEWDDFGNEPEYEAGPDAYDFSARERLRQFFVANDSSVFFVNQLVVQNEATFFHWVTRNAIDYLIGDGFLATEKRKLATGSEIKLLGKRVIVTTSGTRRTS
jgi:hypothetical protein